ncbi:ProQ/FinO family protein [Legionella yabuuchiae]|uniref:ProQ/FinO family protein n=1 Tax=Legionella yabuuchiae TaxID=376727 RepID=UPI001054BDEC|nr:ProQ/FinO family protein [Legionella yabuuchiae]
MRKQELHPRTAIINQKQKNSSKQARLQALRWLAGRFPKAFDNNVQIRPLKKGILNDLMEYADEAKHAGISKSKLREALVVFARRIDYLTAVKAREMRVNLQGEPVEEVTVDEAEKAAAKIKRRVEKSAKNARKTILMKSAPSINAKSSFSSNYSGDQNSQPYYADREPAYGSSLTHTTAPKPAAVVVKHKSTRQYDPEAVARLKEKLGLSRKKEVTE